MRRFPADPEVQKWACGLLSHLVSVLNAAQRVRDAGGGELVVCAMRAHVANAKLAFPCCQALCEMLQQGLASSIDVEAAASLATAALRAHPFDKSVLMSASRLAELLLKSQPTPMVAGLSPERAALARVAELRVRLDFASLVREMDAFPECEELQQMGCHVMYDINASGGSREEAAAAGAIECVARTLDLFPYSDDTQSIGMMALAGLARPLANVHRVGSVGAVRLALSALRSLPNNLSLIPAALTVLGYVSRVVHFRAEALNLGALAFETATLRR